MSMDDSFGSPERRDPNGQPKYEMDLKQALGNIKEAEQVHDLVSKFESAHAAGKKKINQGSITTLETDLTAQALKMSY